MAACPSVTDSSQAPVGHENWVLLVNAPPDIELDADVQRDVVLDRLAASGVDLRPRVEWSATLTPRDLARRYRAPGGAIYGTSSNGRRAAFLRPGNRGRPSGLYLVGGSSHPGGGLPLVTISARIVADLVAADCRRGPTVRPVRRAGRSVRVAAGMLVVRRLARAARRRPPVQVSRRVLRGDITVVVPARDEAMRIGPLLDAVVDAPGVAEVIVVDDESTDATAAVAADAGATVVAGRPLPPGWVGKAWALQQGIDAATGEWVVLLDADARPNPALAQALVGRAEADELDLLTVAGRFDCPTAPAALAAPGDVDDAASTGPRLRARPPRARSIGEWATASAWSARRSTLLAIGGLGAVAHHAVEDIALVRAMASAGFAVEFLDASSLLTVRMYESARQAWTGLGPVVVAPGGRRPVPSVVRPRCRVPRPSRCRCCACSAAGRTRSTSSSCSPASARSSARGRPTSGAAPPTGSHRWPTRVAVLALARGVVDPRRRWRGRTY